MVPISNYTIALIGYYFGWKSKEEGRRSKPRFIKKNTLFYVVYLISIYFFNITNDYQK